MIFRVTVKTFLPVLLCIVFTIILLSALRTARHKRDSMISKSSLQHKVQRTVFYQLLTRKLKVLENYDKYSMF